MTEAELAEILARSRELQPISSYMGEDGWWDDTLSILMHVLLWVFLLSVFFARRGSSGSPENPISGGRGHSTSQSRVDLNQYNAHPNPIPETSSAKDQTRATRKKKTKSTAPDSDKQKLPPSVVNYLSRPIPPRVKQAMIRFESGQFFGSDRSPLAYVGYRVGESGLTLPDRQVRLDVCFRLEIPSILKPAYSFWGDAGSRRRLDEIVRHLKKQANLRRSRDNYSLAVEEWDADARWFEDEY